MFHFPMTKMVRKYTAKLDRTTRDEIFSFYKAFRWMPCFLQKSYERHLRKNKKLNVIFSFYKEVEDGAKDIESVLLKHKKCRMGEGFNVSNYCVAELTPYALEEVLETCSCVKTVHFNRSFQALLDKAVPASRAKNVMKSGKVLTGEGINVAVLDTGVYPHVDLDGRIIAFKDVINNRTKPYDDNGHGTHCAGDVAGNGQVSNGRYKGPAPKANIIGVKVLDREGNGSLESVMRGIEWCILYNKHHQDAPIHVISLSLGSKAIRYKEEEEDPVVYLVNEAWRNGIVVVAAAGNSGPASSTIDSPGVSSTIITVGASDHQNTESTVEDDTVAPFSSRGPTVYGVEKPDILAPGVNIVSLRSPNSIIDCNEPENRVGSGYFSLSGTSMATPICAGVIALILQSNPSLTPNEVKALLKEGADLLREDQNVYGYGFVNGEKAIADA
ncbi:S8 family peptidase [Priestia endophytica]|uniref:Serine protease n=1 Tax=Priestia endophytica TaxID=135735 RepID=A0AAX1QFN3_9BACI|nr:S8 family peptidase [Priestia endophytica]RAS82032.1 serine protease [Priestia endophytica]RAS84605.1 serine protease [Priestia endophytica]